MFRPSDGVDVPERQRATPEPVNYLLLAEYLTALAYPARLELLDVLKFPRQLSEIRLSPLRGAAGAEPAKSAAQSTILGHLNKLVEADLVRAEHEQQGARTHARYQVNPQKLYVLTEELRRITTQHAGHGPAGDATGTLAQPSVAPARRGPRLLLVHGAYEGKSYRLDAQTAGEDGAWVIGRKRGLAVSLDYDPYVSTENTSVARDADGRFVVTDHRGSKNGTLINWAPLPRGGHHVLEPADVIGVGRSLLSFVPN